MSYRLPFRRFALALAALPSVSVALPVGPVPSQTTLELPNYVVNPNSGMYEFQLCALVTARATVRDANQANPAVFPAAAEQVSLEGAEWANNQYGAFTDTGTKLVLNASGVGEFSGFFERAGKLKVRAIYAGGLNLYASTSNEIVVNTSQVAPLAVAPSGTVTIPPNSAYAYNVVFAAPVPGCSAFPDGDVTFTSSRKTVNGLLPMTTKAVPLDKLGSASFFFSASGPGTFELKATFPGDKNFLSASTSALTVVVAEKLVTVSPEAAGANCTYGGQRIDTGLDLDGNTSLAGAEISSTQYVCNGAPGATGDAGVTGSSGADGHDSLVKVTDEPAGSNCPAGGKRIDTGTDVDDNGTLAASEVTSTSYACNGVAGPAGDAGTDGSDGAGGKSSLVAIADEPAGSNCPAGGKALKVGLDSDGSGSLEGNEVTTTSYVCNGAAGAQGPEGAAACNTAGAAPAAWMLALAAAAALRRRRNG